MTSPRTQKFSRRAWLAAASALGLATQIAQPLRGASAAITVSWSAE